MHIPNSGFPFIVFYSSDVESEETHPAQSKLGARTAAGFHARHLVCAKSNRARVTREAPLQELRITVRFLQKSSLARAGVETRPY